MVPVILIGTAGAGFVVVLMLAFARQPSAELAGQHPQVAMPVEKNRQKLRERLIHAGLYKQNSPFFYYSTQIAFATIPVVVGLIGYRLGLMGFNMAILLGMIFGIAGVIAPGLWLDIRKSRRQTKIRRSIPDALDVITICVEAGLSLSAAIVRVSRDLATTHPLLASELTIVHRHAQMGQTSGEALRGFAERFDLSELRSLSSVVIQSERYGASIAATLRVHGETMRTRRMQKAQEKAQKAAVWILLPTVMFIFPALFVVILGPAAYDIYEMMQTVGK